MQFLELIKQPIYWKHTFRIASMFFVLLVIISLLFNSFSDILKFDIDAVIAKNFSDGKWLRFIATKLFISIVYAMFVTSKNMSK